MNSSWPVTTHPAMKQDRCFKFLAATLLLGVVLAFVNPTHAAERKERTKTRSGTYRTGEGKSGTTEGTVTRRQGEVERTGSDTNQDGETATRTSDRQWDKDTGTDTRTTTGAITNADGKTATVDTTVTHGIGEVDKTTTITGPNGKTVERVVATKKNADGTFTRIIQVTNPDGTTSTRTEIVTETGAPVTPPKH